MPEECAAIIDRLISERIQQGMTQGQLAKAAGLHQPVVARLEKKKNVPQLDTILRIASALGCSLEVVSK